MTAPRLSTLLLRVVLDANVLALASLARLLIGLAREERLFSPYWSEEVLIETLRTCTRLNRRGAQGALEHITDIKEGFPNALQTDLAPIIAQCTNDRKDRHVLAAAIKAEAGVVVTFNEKHFAPEHLEKWGIVAMHPSNFLLQLYAKSPEAVGRQLKFAATKKQMRTRDLIRSYSAQLAPFKTALLAALT